MIARAENQIEGVTKDEAIDANHKMRVASRRLSAGSISINKNRLQELLSNPEVKVDVLSDIHANLDALEAVIKDAQSRDVSVFLNVGDLIGFGPFPNETIELLDSKNVARVHCSLKLCF